MVPGPSQRLRRHLTSGFFTGGSENGIFYVLDVHSGHVVWEYHIGVPIKASPAVADHRVLISAFER